MKKTMKRFAALALIVGILFSFAPVSYGASRITLTQAYKKALADAKLTASQVYRVEKDSDDGVYEIEFTKRSNGAEYSYEYSRTGKLLEKSVDYNRARNTGAKKLTKAEAIAKVKSFGGWKASVMKTATASLRTDDGEKVYKVRFSNKAGTYFYEYEVHARTGKILEWEKNRI